MTEYPSSSEYDVAAEDIVCNADKVGAKIIKRNVGHGQEIRVLTHDERFVSAAINRFFNDQYRKELWDRGSY